MSRQDPPVSLVDVAKSLGGRRVLDRLSLTVEPGESVGILGPNGAGKSTTIGLVCGRRAPDSGTCRVFGRDPRTADARRSIGYSPQLVGLPEQVTVGETLGFVAGLHRTGRSPLLDGLGLTDLEHRRCGGLSGGQARLVSVALALVAGAPLVILDEPTANLDLAYADRVWTAVGRHRAAGGALLFTSHHLADVERYADRVLLMDAGAISGDVGPERVEELLGRSRVSFDTTTGALPAEVTEACVSVERDPERWQLVCTDTDRVVRTLVRRGVPLRHLEVRPVSLEEIYQQAVGGTR